MLGIDKFALELINKYKFKSLFAQYFKNIFTIIVIPFTILCILAMVLFSSSLRDDENEYIRSISIKNSNYINTVFSQVDIFAKHMLVDENVLLLLANRNDINNIVGVRTPYERVIEQTESFINYNVCVSDIYLYSRNADYIYALYGESSAYFEKFSDMAWFYEYNSRENADYVANIADEKEDEYITFCYNIGNAENTGILIVKLSVNTLLNEIMLDINSGEKLEIVSDITDENIISAGEIINKSTLNSIELANYPATLNYYIPKRNLSAAVIAIMIVLALLSIAITVFLSYLLAKKQYQSIVTLISSIDNPDMDYDNVSTFNELYYLINKSKNLALTNRNLETELVNKISMLKKAQITALQTQINPHFLFNTLNMISYSVAEDGNEDTIEVRMINLLSNILRYSLNTSEYIVTVDKEIDNLQSYVEILNIKYDNSFDVVWDIDKKVRQLKTLKSIMQPIVENAVEHGIKRLYGKRRGLLKISIYEKQSKLIIDICDNGTGFEPQRLEEVKKMLDSDIIFDGKNVGFKNVVSRINIFFESEGGYEITETAEETHVVIYHPIINM